MRRALWILLALLVGCASHGSPGFEYRWSTQSEWRADPTPAPKGDDVIFLRTTIPSDLGPNGALKLYAPPTLEAVDIDGAPMDLGNRWAVQRLPDGAANKRLTLRYRTRYPVIDPILEFGPEATLGGDVVRGGLSGWALGGGLLLIGLGALASLLLRPASAWFFFGLFAASVGTMELLEVQSFYVLLPIVHVRDPLHESSLYLIACGFAGFAAEVMRRRVLYLIAASAAVAMAVMLLLHFAIVVEAKHLRIVAEAHIVVAILAALIAAFGNTGDRRTRILLIGILAMLVTSIPDLLAGLGFFDDTPHEIHTAKWGVALFVLLLGYVLYGHYGENERALQERVRDVEALNLELRHQIAERSREIARHIPEASMSETPRVGMVVAGRYEILRVLGAGGMGQVFEVVRASDNAHFALKVLHGRSASDAQRFAREAEIAAKIAHPNLVSVVDIGVGTWGTPFIVMELVGGGTLADAELDKSAIRRVLRDVARGLVALHDAHVIHRDLKPTNVLVADLARATGVKLADFGIARIVVSELDATRASKDVTEAGSFLGTPAYMAPELSQGAEHAGPATDSFAFGVMAWQLFSGAYPFPTPLVFLALSNGELPEPPSFEKFEADPVLRKLFEACLSAQPEKRPTAHALLEGLEKRV